ncbi:phage major capsid protein [Sphingomonas melonis]|jgi:HK97 family phage major capsid protein|uniref:phage major capsid protein n=1 Tax=Sphingomonas melonis TaxID=152682 RepID=UPI00037E61F6|nr:phage major capsid protein [Sphingomonas melonis]ATI54164.1 phage major capsid protein [Sphingomonas melonis]
MADNFVTKLGELHSEITTKFDALATKVAAIETAAGRPGAGNVTASVDTKAFDSYLRNGVITPELKAMSAGVPSEGGYTVPKVIDSQIRSLVTDISPMRSVARVVSVSTPDFHLPVSPNGAKSSWVGEKDARPETDSPTITEITPKFGELYASPFVTPTLLEDSQFDIAGFIAGKVATEFARAEGEAFVTGNGTLKPSGLLNVTTALTSDKTRAFGTVQHIVSSVTGGLNADDLIKIVGELKAAYRAGAKWLMTKATKTAIRSLKDTTGQYLFQPSLQAGMPDMLLGYEVVEMEDMPEIAANALAVAFGDFNESYLIADRIGMSMLYNPYANAPYVAYQSRARVGGIVTNTESYKVLKIKAA